ncbi:MAG TPA: type II toxin-antitoxin system VapB family antitoxin [Nitrospiria bacterium]|nr:type II toxin-antitoxin system VapB family antitoxin [Nitrospiria bacterium]
MGRTNIDLNDKLVAEGMKITGCKSKKELVALALEELVAKKSRKKILELEGKIKWTGDINEMRKSRS